MARKFWGWYDNGSYRVGCNGASVWVYDRKDVLRKRFRDIPYVYEGAFQPGTNRFVAKSTEGRLAIYDLDKLECIRTFRYGFDGGQDAGFAFSPDGKFFYLLQCTVDSTQIELGIYRTDDFEQIATGFDGQSELVPEDLEFDEDGTCYLLGFVRDPKTGVLAKGFLGLFDGTGQGTLLYIGKAI